MDYVKYDRILLKISKRIPESERSIAIILTEPGPSITLRFNCRCVELLPRTKMCVGYRVKTIPNLIGETEWYVPVPSHKLFKIEEAMYQEFKEKYETPIINE